MPLYSIPTHRWSVGRTGPLWGLLWAPTRRTSTLQPVDLGLFLPADDAVQSQAGYSHPCSPNLAGNLLTVVRQRLHAQAIGGKPDHHIASHPKDSGLNAGKALNRRQVPQQAREASSRSLHRACQPRATVRLDHLCRSRSTRPEPQAPLQS